jgi:hypothetical protein
MTDKASIKLLLPLNFKRIIQAAARDRGVTMGSFIKSAIAHELLRIGKDYCDPEGQVTDHASL